MNNVDNQPYSAIVRGDIETVKESIANGTDIHRVTANDKWTYLHYAFKSVTRKTPPVSIQYLIDQGLDVNAIDSYGYTPLIYAVRQRNVEGMRLLLENGADQMIEHQDADGISALRMAFDRMPIPYEVVKVLLEYGANPDEKDDGCSVRELIHKIAGVDPKIIELVSHY